MDPTRRALLVASLAAALAASGRGGARAASAAPETGPGHDMSAFPPEWTRADRIAMVAYPGFTALDLVGPHHMFTSLMGAQVQIVAATRAPVVSDLGLAITPDATFDEAPRDLTVLFVPGSGEGMFRALADPETMRFVADRGARADWVTSVCTGSVILAAAGLLDGRRATTHWGAEAALEPLGAVLEPARVVRDGNRITGAGVTAGLDFGLTMLEILRDRDYAMGVQLLAQYDPAPPFAAGSLDTAPPQIAKMMGAMFEGFPKRAVAAGQAARRAL
ncbi:DJ-1/PfpI family protein [uncultured Albimonas sp.]|uniref:DJ-1/PfpI family protein n=1 Tax=uncultured Albimonas sp. TaxID=1331701 RepID=UPI0030ED265B|tara:strand:- start:8625 stop:9452 length:828 start_codon:yes stop_codon:yes gene_type:complete